MQSGAYISLAIYFIAMFSIGIYAYSATKGNVTGFMLGGYSRVWQVLAGYLERIGYGGPLSIWYGVVYWIWWPVEYF